MLSIFPAKAIPTAEEIPWPKEPVDISIPGKHFILGWPCNLDPNFLKVLNSSTGKNPFLANALYKTGAAWPFDNTNLSLSGFFGLLESMFISLKKSVVTISAADKDPPGCPDADSVNIETISFLISLDIDFNSSTLLTIWKPPL